MRLSKKFDFSLLFCMAILSGLILTSTLTNPTVKTFAESEELAEEEQPVVTGPFYVTIYDAGKKTIVKTGPKTIGEIIEKAGILLNPTDSIEPSLDSVVDADNFFINIYRSYPVVIRDGVRERYLMTSSHDPKTIVNGANIVVYDGDEISVVENSGRFLETGVAPVYQIVRNGGRTITVEEEVAFSERTVKDYNLSPGETEVRQLGEVGRKKIVYNVQYVDNVETSKELVSEEIIKNPVERIVAIGASWIERNPLTPSMGRNRYTYQKPDGSVVERQETFYDLDMHLVMNNCGGGGYYTVRDDGVKVDKDGYVIIAADLNRYPRCSVVETSVGQGKVYDTGTFARTNPEQFDIATDWTNRNGT